MSPEEQRAEDDEARQLLIEQDVPITPANLDRARRAVRLAGREHEGRNDW